MSEVKRWSPLPDEEYAAMEGWPTEYVSSADYDALSDECERLRKDAERYIVVRRWYWNEKPHVYHAIEEIDQALDEWIAEGHLHSDQEP